MKKPIKIASFSLILILFLANLTIWFFEFSLPKDNLEIKFFDVGQGDSIFIRTPSNYRILIDGGPNNKVVNYLDSELPIWDRKLDLIILTHPQSDHLFGLIEVVKRFKVGKLLISGVEGSSSVYKLWIKTLHEYKIKPIIVTESSNLIISDKVKFDILWPLENFPKVSDLNEAAIVFRLSYGNFDTLFTADADQKVQPYKGDLSGIEVLKVPHHGSKTGMSDDFIEKVRPKVSVITVGKNTYGHPGVKTINQLNKFGSKIFRTDQNGTIEIVSDGNRWYTKSQR